MTGFLYHDEMQIFAEPIDLPGISTSGMVGTRRMNGAWLDLGSLVESRK